MSNALMAMKTALETIQAAHRFNVASMPAHEVHALCFEALQPKSSPAGENASGIIKALMASAMEPNGLEGLGGPYLELNPEKLVLAVVRACQAQIENVALSYQEPQAQGLQDACWKAHEQIAKHFGLEG